MLNELVSIERALSAAKLQAEPRHPDVKLLGKSEALRIHLGHAGLVTGVELLPAEAVSRLWTMRSGQHNSFPFLQIKNPILGVPDPDRLTPKEVTQAKSRRALQGLTQRFEPADWVDSWPGEGLKNSLRQRRGLLAQLEGGTAAAVPAVIDRFLKACQAPRSFFRAIVDALIVEVDEGGDEWLKAARQLLVEKGGALYIDVDRNEFDRGVAYPGHAGPVSRALESDGADTADRGVCALSGDTTRLLTGNFPQPNLPLLGQTYLFSRNSEIPAAHRYGRFAATAFPIGLSLAQKLGGAIEELTAPTRLGKTWRTIPGERPKQTDLLLVFVEAAPDAEVADLVAQGDLPESGEQPIDVDPEAAFEARAERVLSAVKAREQRDFANIPVQLLVLRQVDPANRKLVYHREISVGHLYDMARQWVEGERNLPAWLRLPLPGKRGSKAIRGRPPHVAPLQLPGLTRNRFIRGGAGRTEAVGISAQAAFSVFPEPRNTRLAQAVLRLLLRGYGPLLSGCTHALRKGIDHVKSFDRGEALRGVTLLGVLLHKLGRRETYMTDVAFRLGQLLSATDTVHVGYCMDRRNGAVPPTLLGNSVFAVAQKDPIQALALLCRRWKPYGSWARQARAATDEARRVEELARDLHGNLPSRAYTNDLFRAELLLGYVAGLPPRNDNPAAKDENMTESS